MYYLTGEEASEADEAAEDDAIDDEEEAWIKAFEVSHNQFIVEMYCPTILDATEASEATEANAFNDEEEARINEAVMVAHDLCIEEEAKEAAETAEVLYNDAVSRYKSNTSRWHDEWVLGMTLPVVACDDRTEVDT
eukprot:scaffold19175_cov67-Attheya_sp.AAC.1